MAPAGSGSAGLRKSPCGSCADCTWSPKNITNYYAEQNKKCRFSSSGLV